MSTRFSEHLYGDSDPERQVVDIFDPVESRGLPVVLIHGGSLTSLSRARMRGIAAWLADSGHSCFNLGYRLVPAAPYPAPLDDVLAAIDWIRSPEGGDVSRFILMGASAGAFLATTAACLLARGPVAGVVAISGPSRFFPAERDLPIADSIDPELRLGPTQLARPGVPPLLATHSRADRVVPVNDSIQLAEAWRSAGADAELHLYDSHRTDHAIWRDPDAACSTLTEELEAIVLRFLMRLSQRDSRES